MHASYYLCVKIIMIVIITNQTHPVQRTVLYRAYGTREATRVVHALLVGRHELGMAILA